VIHQMKSTLRVAGMHGEQARSRLPTTRQPLTGCAGLQLLTAPHGATLEQRNSPR
jgi:hypothetical protein